MRLYDLLDNKQYGSYYDTDAEPKFIVCTLESSAAIQYRAGMAATAKPYLED
jgi:hypothetical protein